MRGRSAFSLVSVMVFVLAACGGTGGGDAAGSTTTVLGSGGAVDTTTVAPPQETTPSSTASTSTSSTTTTSTTTTTTTPPTTVAQEVNCLEGSWWLSPAETTNLYAALLPDMPVTVTGTHWAEFSGDTVDFWVVLEARFAVGGIDVTFGIDQHGVGTYTVVDDVLTMSYDTFESTIHEGHGTAITDPELSPETYADEAVDLVESADGTITINRVTVPVIEVPPVAGGPMGCDDTTMSLGFTSGLADTAAVYVRRG